LAQAVQSLLYKHKALSSNISPTPPPKKEFNKLKKNTLKDFKSRLDQVEERISELETGLLK
jgi:hypothetical protein